MSTVEDVVQKTRSKSSRNAKNKLVNFVRKINPQLKDFFDKETIVPFGVSPKEKELTKTILDHIKEHNLRPAKRLRGSLAYYGFGLFDKPMRVAMDAAMSVEIIHTALLMHDDFMDQDDTRRGLPTTHKFFQAFHKTNKYRHDSSHYGEAMAVTAGDVALCLGYEILSRTQAEPTRKVEAITRILRGITNTCYGQAYDVTLESRGKAKEDDIINLHHAKTAIYTYENPLHVGAILAGAGSKELELLSKYAIPGGIAFQLQDDILGLFGNPKKTGKPAHSDLRQGKMTLLIIKALELGNKDQVDTILKIWGKHNLTENEAIRIRKIVIDTGSLEYSKKISIKWAKKAQEVIPEMKKKGWIIDSVNYLDGIAQYMVEREW